MSTTTQKTFLITGTSAGLGRIMTERLLQRGDRVVATSRRANSLAELQAAHPDTLIPITLDLSDDAALRAGIDAAFGKAGRIDTIVSNAGYGLFGAAEELDDAEILKQLDVNLLGSIRLIRAVLPHLRRQGGGRILQVSSEGGQIAYPNFSIYHATKWGIEGFVEAVTQEVAGLGISFVIVEPGPTATNFGANLTIAPALEAYADTPSGAIRKAVAEGSFETRGDAGRTVAAMIRAADAANPPLRLTLGSTAYASIGKALRGRLDALEAQRDEAFSADRD